jgi:hypothetical protein
VTTQGRVVALKILPPHLSADEEFRQRFRREAPPYPQRWWGASAGLVAAVCSSIWLSAGAGFASTVLGLTVIPAVCFQALLVFAVLASDRRRVPTPTR